MSMPNEPCPRVLPGMLSALVLSLILHPLVGWVWTAAAGAAGGWVSRRRGWLAGALGGAAAWSLIAAWNFTVDTRAVAEMNRVVATILGDLPTASTAALTVVIGALLGGAGGLLGEGLRNILATGGR